MAVAALMWWVAYAGVYKLRILEDQLAIRSLRSAEAESTAAPPKVEPPTISVPTPDDNYAVELDRLMKQEHLYRNPDLGRRVVADALGISEGYVSEVMRKQVGQSFAEYVNNFRITEAKSLLRDAEFAQFSLEAVGLEAGFKSRSAFYTAFKKATNMSPGKYRKGEKTS